MRRLFLLPAIIASYSPEPATQWHGKTSAPTAERKCVLKSQKSVSERFTCMFDWEII
jgi:hypothetical protein